MNIDVQAKTLFITLFDSETFARSYFEFILWSKHESPLVQIAKKRIQLDICYSWLLHVKEGEVLTFNYLLDLNE
jgi:hypothetical protein